MSLASSLFSSLSKPDKYCKSHVQIWRRQNLAAESDITPSLFVGCVLFSAPFCGQVCRTCMRVFSSSDRDNNAGETSRGTSSLCCFGSAPVLPAPEVADDLQVGGFVLSAPPKFRKINPSTLICAALGHIPRHLQVLFAIKGKPPERVGISRCPFKPSVNSALAVLVTSWRGVQWPAHV